MTNPAIAIEQIHTLRSQRIRSWITHNERGNASLTTDEIKALPLETTKSSIRINVFNRYYVAEDEATLSVNEFRVHFGMTGFADSIATCKALLESKLISDAVIKMEEPYAPLTADVTTYFPSKFDLELSEEEWERMVRDVVMATGVDLMMNNIAPVHAQSSIEYVKFLESQGFKDDELPDDGPVH